MKRVLLLGIILAICILAMPQGVLALTDTNNATVTASVSDYAVLKAAWEPTGGAKWNLNRGANTCTNCINLTVDSSTGWTTQVRDENNPDKGLNKSHMKEATTGAFLKDVFQFKGTDLIDNLAVGSGVAQPPTTLTYNVGQTVEATDDTQFDYSIILFFTLTAN